MFQNTLWLITLSISYFMALSVLTGAEATAQQLPIQNQLTSPQGSPRFIKFNTSAKRKTNARVSMPSDIQILKEYLPMQKKDTYQQIRSTKEKDGTVHNVYQQYHNGIEVAFGTYTVHRTSTEIKNLSGSFVPIDKGASPTPSLDKEAALRKALEQMKTTEETNGNSLSEANASSLVYCKDFNNKRDEQGHLAYKFRISGTAPLRLTEVFIDAQDGKVLLTNELIKDHAHPSALHGSTKSNKLNRTGTRGNTVTQYHGFRQLQTDAYEGGFRLLDKSRGGGIHTKNGKDVSVKEVYEPDFDFNVLPEFIDDNNNWTPEEWDNKDYDLAALDAHWALGQTYDYFLEAHDRNSYDNKGGRLHNLVHIGYHHYNAFWHNGTLHLGDGSGLPLTSIDFVAHEMTHGVTETSANLIYYAQPGALNESISDIFAAAVKSKKMPERSIWEINPIAAEKTPIRDMSNPNRFGHPDTYKGKYWKGYIELNADSRYVHTNSSVLNHWFYLLSEGKKGVNDDGTAYNVQSIGIDKAAKITYRMLTVYLEPTSDYIFAKYAGIQAAEDLFGTGSFEVEQVTEAFKAIGVEDYKGVSCENNIKNFRATFAGVKTISVKWEFGEFDDRDEERFVFVRYRSVNEESYRYGQIEGYTNFVLSEIEGTAEIGIKTPCNDTWETIFVEKPAPCGKVKNLKLLQADKDKEELSLSWDAVNGASTYKLLSYSQQPTTSHFVTDNKIEGLPYVGIDTEQRVVVYADCNESKTEIYIPALSPPSLKILSPQPMDTVGKSFQIEFDELEDFFYNYEGNAIQYFVDNKPLGTWNIPTPIPILFLEPGKHVIKLVLLASNEEYKVTPGTTDSVSIFVDELVPSSIPPSAELGSSHTFIPEGDKYQTVVKLDAIFSKDIDGTISYHWDIDGGRFVEETGKGDKIVKVAFAGDKEYYDILLTVTDNDGNKTDSEIRIRTFADNSRAVEKPNESIPNNENEMVVYPNPADKMLYVSIPNSFSTAEIYLMDMQGKKIVPSTSNTENTVTVDVSQFRAGVYRLVLLSGKSIYHEMVVVE